MGQPVVVEEVHGPQCRAVTNSLADLAKLVVELCLVNLTQEPLAEELRHILHLLGDRGVVSGQVCMVAAGVHNTHGMFIGVQVKGHILHLGFLRVGKVHGCDAAHGACHLVQQARGFSEVDILGVLSYLCGSYGVDIAVVIKMAHNCHHQYFKGRGAGQA